MSKARKKKETQINRCIQNYTESVLMCLTVALQRIPCPLGQDEQWCKGWMGCMSTWDHMRLCQPHRPTLSLRSTQTPHIDKDCA